MPALSRGGGRRGVGEHLAHARAPPPFAMGKKRAAEPEPEPELEHEEAGDDEPEEKVRAKKKADPKLRNEKHKSKVFRSTAVAAGRDDVLSSAITVSSARKMMTWKPGQLSRSSYSPEEAEARIKLAFESVPASAARVAQGKAELLLRKLVEDAVRRMVDCGGVTSVSPHIAYEVLKKYAPHMDFTGVLPPPGLVRHAQTTVREDLGVFTKEELRELDGMSDAEKKEKARDLGVPMLERSNEDEEAAEAEKEANIKLAKLVKMLTKKQEKEKEERKANRAGATTMAARVAAAATA